MYAPAARKIQGREVRLREHTEYRERNQREERRNERKKKKRGHLFTLTKRGAGHAPACSRSLSHTLINMGEKEQQRVTFI